MTLHRLPVNGVGCKFTRTMPIQIGAVQKLELIEQARAVRELGSYAESMMRHELFTTLDMPETAFQIELTPADLGFTENPTTTDLFNEKRLAEWSAANLEGSVVELNPAEVGPHLAIQYLNQPNGEVIWIAMKRLPDSMGRPDVFNVRRGALGELCLNAACAHPGDRWPLGYRPVFRLRKVT